MTIIQRVLLAIVSMSLLLSTVELIRRRKLKEEYSLLWILTGLVILLFMIFPEILYYTAEVFQIHYLTAMLFIIFLFLLIIVLHYSTVISKMTEREKELAQELALLSLQIEELKNRE